MAPKRKILKQKRFKIEQKKLEEYKTKDNINPFELRHNKIKHQILGRKIAKNECGKPLINRNRAFKKREETLLQEYKNRHKSGRGLQDFREENVEQRMINKYRNEQNQISFNNNETFLLTHKGKPLDELIDERISDEEDVDLFNKDDYIETSHFGGGGSGPSKNKNDILSEIIAEKARMKIEREEVNSLIKELDDQWDNDMKKLIFNNSKQIEINTPKQNSHDYDNLYNDLLLEGPFGNSNKNEYDKKAIPENSEQNLPKTPDSLFKNKLNLIEKSNDIDQVIKLIKELIYLLPKVTKKSLAILKDRLTSLAEVRLKFSPKEIAILILSAYFKELQVMIHMIILKTLNKIKYSTLNEIACAIFLNKFLLKTASNDKIYPEIFIHLENLVCLCLPKEKVQIKLFHRLEYETKCILNVAQFDNNENDIKYSVTLSNLFGNIFKPDDNNERIAVAYDLMRQIFQLILNFYEKYSISLSAIGFMLKSTIDKISNVILKAEISNGLRNYFLDYVTKFEHASTKSVITNIIKSKPFILPMLEPKFEENLKIKPRLTERKKLVKKYKREFKGAQREIRNDSKFLRNTYLKEMERKDRIRKNKVKEILKDLSIQQGLYKKKK